MHCYTTSAQRLDDERVPRLRKVERVVPVWVLRVETRRKATGKRGAVLRGGESESGLRGLREAGVGL